MAGGQYGHPDQSTIDNLLDIGAKIYGTDVCGTVVITTDGQEEIIQTETGDCVRVP
jgi:competence protein ComEC